MFRKYATIVLTCALVLALLAGCGASSGSGLPQTAASSAEAEPAIVSAASQAATSPAETSVADALAANQADHEDSDDYAWDSASAVEIRLGGDSIAVDGEGVSVDGSQVTIVTAGTYVLNGSLDDGQIVVNTQDEQIVRLVLNGVDLSSSTGAPIYIMAADKVVIVLADGTENRVSDADAYVFESGVDEEPNAAIFSMADLTLCGHGRLAVEGHYADGITSKDGLIITSGTMAVTAADDGIRGKDYLVVRDGAITVASGGDGLKADNEEDATRGYVAIEGGTLVVTAGGDAIAAQTDVLISNGDLNLTSGGGSQSQIDQEASAKGIKGQVSVIIDGGTVQIDAADDAIHSNGSVVINGGTFTLSSGDDALHADSTLDVKGGEIHVIESYEGLESSVITIDDGIMYVVSSDDGLNVGGGADGSGAMPGPGRGGGRGQASPAAGDAFTGSGSYRLDIHGGTVIIDAAGDGIDVNGAILMTGGTVLVSGPTVDMNGALDYDSGFQITGGLLVAAGSSGMAAAPDRSSTQYSVLLNLDTIQPAGTLVHVEDNEGTGLFTFAPANDYQSVVFSGPAIANGATYTVYLGGSATGTVHGGLYQEGIYTPGSEYTSLTISGVVTVEGGHARW